MFGRKKIESFDLVTVRFSTMRAVYEWEIVPKGECCEISEYGLAHTGTNRVLQRKGACPLPEMIALFNECRLLSWDGFFGKHPRHVTDGTAFSLQGTVNGRSVRADGSQNFPKGYREFVAAVGGMLKEE